MSCATAARDPEEQEYWQTREKELGVNLIQIVSRDNGRRGNFCKGLACPALLPTRTDSFRSEKCGHHSGNVLKFENLPSPRSLLPIPTLRNAPVSESIHHDRVSSVRPGRSELDAWRSRNLARIPRLWQRSNGATHTTACSSFRTSHSQNHSRFLLPASSLLLTPQSVTCSYSPPPLPSFLPPSAVSSFPWRSSRSRRWPSVVSPDPPTPKLLLQQHRLFGKSSDWRITSSYRASFVDASRMTFLAEW